MHDFRPHIPVIFKQLREPGCVRDAGVALAAAYKLWWYLRFEVRADHGQAFPSADVFEALFGEAAASARRGDWPALFEDCRYIGAQDHEQWFMETCRNFAINSERGNDASLSELRPGL